MRASLRRRYRRYLNAGLAFFTAAVFLMAFALATSGSARAFATGVGTKVLEESSDLVSFVFPEASEQQARVAAPVHEATGKQEDGIMWPAFAGSDTTAARGIFNLEDLERWLNSDGALEESLSQHAFGSGFSTDAFESASAGGIFDGVGGIGDVGGSAVGGIIASGGGFGGGGGFANGGGGFGGGGGGGFGGDASASSSGASPESLSANAGSAIEEHASAMGGHGSGNGPAFPNASLVALAHADSATLTSLALISDRGSAGSSSGLAAAIGGGTAGANLLVVADEVVAVPEPSTLLMLAGAAAVARPLRRRWWRRAAA